MAHPRKLLHIEMIVDASVGWDIMSLADGKALQLNVRTVKHGGQDQQTGELKKAPTGREVVLAVAHTGKSFTTTDLNTASERMGAVSKQAAAVALNAMMREGALKRIAPKTYVLVKQTKQKAAHPKQTKVARKRESGDNTTISAKVIAFVRSKQNGNGEGIKLADIITHVGKPAASVRSQCAKLAADNKLQRIDDGLYRVPAGA